MIIPMVLNMMMKYSTDTSADPQSSFAAPDAFTEPLSCALYRLIGCTDGDTCSLVGRWFILKGMWSQQWMSNTNLMTDESATYDTARSVDDNNHFFFRWVFLKMCRSVRYPFWPTLYPPHSPCICFIAAQIWRTVELGMITGTLISSVEHLMNEQYVVFLMISPLGVSDSSGLQPDTDDTSHFHPLSDHFLLLLDHSFNHMLLE